MDPLEERLRLIEALADEIRDERRRPDEVKWSCGVQATIDWSADPETVKAQTQKAGRYLANG